MSVRIVPLKVYRKPTCVVNLFTLTVVQGGINLGLESEDLKSYEGGFGDHIG